MSYFGKTYNYVKHEKFDEWLKAAGIPENQISAILNQKPTQKIVQNGDSYTITQSSSQGNKETTFKSGVEFDDTLGDGGGPVKTTFTVSGNTVTEIVKSPDDVTTFKREFNGDELVVTITSNKHNGVAKRYFKA